MEPPAETRAEGTPHRGLARTFGLAGPATVGRGLGSRLGVESLSPYVQSSYERQTMVERVPWLTMD